MTSSWIRRGAALFATVVVAAAATVSLASPASASKPDGGMFTEANYASIAASPRGGVWTHSDELDNLAGSKTRGLGGAPFHGETTMNGTLMADPGTRGYYIVDVRGKVTRFLDGAPIDAPSYIQTDMASLRNAVEATWPDTQDDYVVGAAIHPSGLGMWVVLKSGELHTLGIARPHGDRVGSGQTPTGIVATPSGNGYYIVEADGGVFAYGDATFYGSTGGNKPNGKHVTGIALHRGPSGSVDGYWLVDETGGIHTFGAAPFYGSTGGNTPDWVTSITATPTGYAIVHENGRAEVFGPNNHYQDLYA